MVCSLAACATNLKVVKPDAKTGLYTDAGALVPTDVKVAEKFDRSAANIVYVKTPDNPNERFVTFFVEALKDSGVFKQVLRKDDLQSYVIQNKLEEKVPSVSDLIGVSKLAKEMGPILVFEANATFKGAYQFDGYIKVTDAGSGKLLLDIEKEAFNWNGLDAPLYHPMLNGFLHWTRNEPITGP